MIDSRETILKSIRFEIPERIPTLFWEWGDNDIEFLDFGVRYTPIDGEHNRDEFGCVWECPKGHSTGYVVQHSLTELKNLDRYRRIFAACRAAEEIVDTLADLTGGLIAGIYRDPASCGVDSETQAFGVEVFQRGCDRFSRSEMIRESN